MQTRSVTSSACGIAAMIAWVAGGCGAADADAPLATVHDSAGIRIVENVVPDSGDVAWWRVETPAAVDIGGEQADEAHSLYQVFGAARLSDGRIVVSNGGSSDVRWYAADGRHLRTSGRRGDGPGEFQRPSRIVVLPGDTVLVTELVNGRITVLDPAGDYVRDFQLAGTGPASTLIGDMADGTLIGTLNAIAASRGIENGLQRPELTVISLAGTGSTVDTLVTVPGREVFLRVRQSGGQIQSINLLMPPFQRITMFAVDDDEVLIGTQDEPEVRAYAADGRLTRIIRTGAPMRPITPEHRDAWIERQVENAPPEMQEGIRSSFEDLPAPETMPPYGALETDPAGNLWIADYDDRLGVAGVWSIHDPVGRLIARVRLPERFRVFHIGEDFVLGIERDELDVEHLRLHALMRR